MFLKSLIQVSSLKITFFYKQIAWCTWNLQFKTCKRPQYDTDVLSAGPLRYYHWQAIINLFCLVLSWSASAATSPRSSSWKFIEKFKWRQFKIDRALWVTSSHSAQPHFHLQVSKFIVSRLFLPRARLDVLCWLRDAQCHVASIKRINCIIDIMNNPETKGKMIIF